MTKVMRIGTMDTGNGRRASIFIKVQTEQPHFPNQKDYLSICGVIGPLSSGNCLGGCGQIDMQFSHRNLDQNDKRCNHPVRPSDIRFAPHWHTVKWWDLLDIWHTYHLKDTDTIPDDIIQKLKSMPDADKTPAWV